MSKRTKILKALTLAFIITALVAIMMISANASTQVEEGTFANADYPNATWTWSYHDDGTLYIGGTGTGTTEFFYGGNSSDAGKKNIPWLNGTLNRKNITKVVFAEETGITSLGQYALYYLESAKEIVIPSTVTKLDTHCFRRLFSLETISVHGKTDAGEGVYDLRNITSMGKAFSESAKSVSGPIELWFGEGAITFPKITEAWYMPATSIIFRVVEGSAADTALSAFVERQKGTTPDTNSSTNVEMAYFETSEEPDVPTKPTSGTSQNGNYSWEIDVTTGTLTFTNDGRVQFLFNDTETAFLDWVELWRNDIKHIVVPDFARYKFDTNNYDHPFANLPNLETVEWNTPIIQSMVRGKTTKGMFYGCEKLTTFGSSETFETGVINLSGLTFEYTNANNYSVSMFAGCESIKKVVFGNAMYLKDMNVANELDFIVGKSMFEGCTALESVEFEKVEGLLASAFKDCSSLKGDITYLGDPAIADAFKGCGGVVIHTDDVEKVKTMLDSMETAGVKPGEAMVSGMVHGGFAVRVAGYNGLRSFYTFVGEDNATYDGFTLVEYGSILASENTYALYTKDIGGILRLNGTEFVTPDANKVVKKALYMADGYTGEVETKKKINDDGTVEFVVTTVNFKVENYNSGIVMNGYEIWKDSNNNYILILSDYHKKEYKVNSLYKTTMAMLVADHIEIGAETAPVYNTITQIAGKKDFDCGVENVSSFVVPHPLSEGKMVAVYMTDSEKEIELFYLGLPEDIIEKVTDCISTPNIKINFSHFGTVSIDGVNLSDFKIYNNSLADANQISTIFRVFGGIDIKVHTSEMNPNDHYIVLDGTELIEHKYSIKFENGNIIIKGSTNSLDDAIKHFINEMIGQKSETVELSSEDNYEGSTGIRSTYTKAQLLQVLDQVYADPNKLIIGQQAIGSKNTRDPDGVAVTLEAFKKATGQMPGIIGIDLGCYGFDLMRVSETEWSQYIGDLVEFAYGGGIVTISSHWANPSGNFGDGTVRGEFGYDDTLEGYQKAFTDLITEGTEYNTAFKTELDLNARFLKALQDNGVPVIWRPLHEANGDWFWYCIRQGVDSVYTLDPSYFIDVWKYVYEYFTEEWGLTELIWCYAPNYSRNVNNAANSTMSAMYLYPGDEYCDIVGVDWYHKRKDELEITSNNNYSLFVNETGKTGALTEFGPGDLLLTGDVETQIDIYNCMDLYADLMELAEKNYSFAYLLTWTTRYGVTGLGLGDVFMETDYTLGQAEVKAMFDALK